MPLGHGGQNERGGESGLASTGDELLKNVNIDDLK